MSDRVCSVEECEKPRSSLGLCNAHYKRLRKHGTIEPRFRGAIVDGKRICPRCKVDQPIADWGAADCCKACNRANSRKHYSPVQASRHTCLACGRQFMGDQRQTVACSTECRRARKAAWDLEFHQTNAEATAQAQRRWAEANRDKMAEKEGRRRARLRGAAIGPIDLDALWTGACGICDGVIDAALRSPDPGSRSLDHVVPLARGGAHSQDNLQWTHLRCNVRKGARLTEAVI